MRYTVDRKEAGFAVLEDENSEYINVPLSALPEGIKDGSVLVFRNNQYFPDADYEAERRKAIFEKQQRLLNRKK